jgi:hypothetical protein
MNIVIIANCHADEYARYFLSNEPLMKSCRIYRVTTYHTPPPYYLDLLKIANLIITQDVKSIPEFTFNFVSSNANPAAKIFLVPFWRFDGLWPDEKNLCEILFFPSDDDQNSSNDNNIDPIEKYEMGIEKFRSIEENSFLKLESLLKTPHITSKFFSDNHHPLPLLFYHPISEIFSTLGLDPPTSALKPININRNRRRLLPKNISALSVQKIYSFFWLDTYVSEQVYKKFVLYLLNFSHHLQTFRITELDAIWQEFKLSILPTQSQTKIEVNKSINEIHGLGFKKIFETNDFDYYGESISFEIDTNGFSNIKLEVKGKTPSNIFIDIPFKLTFLNNNLYSVTLNDGVYAYTQFQLSFYSNINLDGLVLFKIISYFDI